MNETPNDSDKAAKEAKATRMLRYICMFIILLSVVNILLVLYNSRNNVSHLSGILLPLGMIFFGLAMPMIVDKEKKVPAIILVGIAMILILSELGWEIFR